MGLGEVKKCVDIVGVSDCLVLHLVLFVLFGGHKFYFAIFRSLHIEFLVDWEVLFDTGGKYTFLHHFSKMFLHFLLSAVKFRVLFGQVLLPIFEVPFELFFVVKSIFIDLENRFPDFCLGFGLIILRGF
jgi:hypothetical protein